MVVEEANAADYRCCGPDNCGKLLVKTSEDGLGSYDRYCLGAKCMAWTRVFAHPPMGYCGLTRRDESR